MIEVVLYETEAGECPFREWFNDLDAPAAAKLRAAVARMETGNFGDAKPVGDGVSEQRIHSGPGYRVYFARDGEQIVVLLGGGTKRRQRSDIAKAKECWSDYKKRKRWRRAMALTRSFKETVRDRAVRDTEFRIGLLNEAIEAFLRGELPEGKILLRDYVNATIGFEQLGELTQKSPKSLMRMLGPEGNPRAGNLFSVISHLQRREGVELGVRARR